MSDPCQQASNIESINKKMDRILDVLTQVAVQKTEIDHLTTAVLELREWNRSQEKRIQDLEKAPGNGAIKMFWLFFGPIAAALVTSIVLAGGK